MTLGLDNIIILLDLYFKTYNSLVTNFYGLWMRRCFILLLFVYAIFRKQDYVMSLSYE